MEHTKFPLSFQYEPQAYQGCHAFPVLLTLVCGLSSSSKGHKAWRSTMAAEGSDDNVPVTPPPNILDNIMPTQGEEGRSEREEEADHSQASYPMRRLSSTSPNPKGGAAHDKVSGSYAYRPVFCPDLPRYHNSNIAKLCQFTGNTRDSST